MPDLKENVVTFLHDFIPNLPLSSKVLQYLRAPLEETIHMVKAHAPFIEEHTTEILATSTHPDPPLPPSVTGV